MQCAAWRDALGDDMSPRWPAVIRNTGYSNTTLRGEMGWRHHEPRPHGQRPRTCRRYGTTQCITTEYTAQLCAHTIIITLRHTSHSLSKQHAVHEHPTSSATEAGTPSAQRQLPQLYQR